MDNYRSQRPRPKRVNIDGFVRPQQIGQRPPVTIKEVVASHRPATPPKLKPLDSPQAYPTNYLQPRSKRRLPQSLSQSSTRTTTPKPVLPPFYPSSSAGMPNVIKIQKPLERNRGKKPFKLIYRRLIASGLALILLTIYGTGGWIGYRFIGSIDKVFGGNIISNLSDLVSSNVQLKGQSTGRVNILLAGDSSDDPGHGGANLTDSILVMSIDTQNDTAFLLSIPRDLWVDIPGFGFQKINAANDNDGTNFPGYPQNGMGQLEHVIVTDLGIPIDYYALMDYGAFKDAVNAVGGITITINSPDPRGLYDPNADIKLPNGSVTLNGQEALNLARARGDGPGSYGFPDSDFNRTEHQRQLFTAVAEKAKSIGVLTNPIKISNLFNAFGNNVETDLNLQDVLSMIQTTKNMNLSNVQSYSYCSTLTLGQNGCEKAILTDYTDPASGQEALIPTAGIGDYTQMGEYYQQLSSSNPVAKENASVVVMNGTATPGLAKTAETALIAKDIDVVNIADASQTYPSSTIIDNSGGDDPATLALLKSIYGNNVTTKGLETSSYNPAFIVVLGENVVTSSSKSTT